MASCEGLKDCVVIDGFLPEPEKVRKELLSLPFYDVRGPERELYKHVQVRPSDEFKGLIEAKLNRTIEQGYTFARMNFEGEPPNSAIHADQSYDDWAAILYLNTPEQCRGGTAFWKHKKTGYTQFPEEWEIRRFGKSPKRVWNSIISCWNTPEAWEQTGVADMKWNRLVFYPTKQFHSRWPFLAWGNSPENARLIWITFFSLCD